MGEIYKYPKDLGTPEIIDDLSFGIKSNVYYFI